MEQVRVRWVDYVDAFRDPVEDSVKSWKSSHKKVICHNIFCPECDSILDVRHSVVAVVLTHRAESYGINHFVSCVRCAPLKLRAMERQCWLEQVPAQVAILTRLKTQFKTLTQP